MAAAKKNSTLAAPGAVDPAAVEGALAGLWRQAAELPHLRGEGSLTRACLWNLVIYNPKPESDFRDVAGHGYGLRTLMDDVLSSLPSRIIRLEFTEDKELPVPGKEAAAWVATKFRETGAGTGQIYGEEVNLAVLGEAGNSHFPSLVRSLMHADLPVALLWLDDLPHRGWLLQQMLDLSSRVLIDSLSAEQQSDLAVIHELARETAARFIDIGWMRLAPLRHLLAGLFDPPGRAEQLGATEHILVEATPGAGNAGLLLLGWLLSRLGYDGLEALGPPQEGGGHRWKVAREAGTLTLELSIRQGEGGADGILRAEIRAGGETFVIRQVDARHVAREAPQRIEPKIPLHGWSDAELVVAGLGAHGIDAIYPEAMRAVAALLEAEVWNR